MRTLTRIQAVNVAFVLVICTLGADVFLGSTSLASDAATSQPTVRFLPLKRAGFVSSPTALWSRSEVLVAVYRTGTSPQIGDLYRLDLRTGSYRHVATPSRSGCRWVSRSSPQIVRPRAVAYFEDCLPGSSGRPVRLVVWSPEQGRRLFRPYGISAFTAGFAVNRLGDVVVAEGCGGHRAFNAFSTRGLLSSRSPTGGSEAHGSRRTANGLRSSRQ
jgi:hypothetical protein